MHENMDDAYMTILETIEREGIERLNRKNQKLLSLKNYSFTLKDPMKCFVNVRPAKLDYLLAEFEWYLSGSLRLEDAKKTSSFWEKCTDDGKTVNSNYGFLMLHDKNSSGKTQVQHAMECLTNNRHSKKAVMTLYNNDHAYMSNDNPCTMFMSVHISGNKLHATTVVRSNDVHFGVPYDVPWFCFMQYKVWRSLKTEYPTLELGTYTHTAMDMHRYETRCVTSKVAKANYPNKELMDQSDDAIQSLFVASNGKLLEMSVYGLHALRMEEAWDAASSAVCLKKKVGAILVGPRDADTYAFHGGRNNNLECKECARDTGEKFYSDGCWSVHSEMKCILAALKDGHTSFEGWTIYVTHGPCDACLKLCDYVGIKKVIYDKDYKTDYTHWPNIEVLKLNDILGIL